MVIRLECPHCGKRIKAPESHAGQRALCPRCRDEVFVPELASVAEPAERAAAGGGGGRSGHDEAGGGVAPPTPPPEEEDLIDMTAMVDIVFFLLIFFMVTSLHSKQASIAVPPAEQEKPNQAPGSGPKKEADDSTTVRIDADNSIWVDDEEAPSKQDLIARLRDSGDSHMVVRANGDAKHGTVILVLDAGTEAGIDDVRLITETDSDS